VPQVAYLQAEPMLDERRSSRRKRLWLSASAQTSSGERTKVVVHDISATGLLLESSVALPLGEELSVATPDQEIGRATVVWSSGRFFGCRFSEPIPTVKVSASKSALDALPKKGSPEAVALAAVQLRELSMAIDRISRVVERAFDGFSRRER
jgi:hypothetical protein